LGSLVSTMERFKLNSRQIRTAVFRLVQNGWLESERFGRRSIYGLSALGIQDYGRATSQIYRSKYKPWNGQWTILACNKEDFFDYANFRKQLYWLGFGELHGGTFVHPNLDIVAFNQLVAEFRVVDQIATWDGQLTSTLEGSSVLLEAWDFTDLRARFEKFLSRFSVLMSDMSEEEWSVPVNSFVVRVLLIHEYRRILLQVADLPEAIFPENWPGIAAMSLAKIIYSKVSAPSQLFVSRNLENRDGFFSHPTDEFSLRFR
jgi:phenylacetic acid degradation operon negative regulatory protein